MSHLLMLNLGPVQGFIAAARRTRDLWFGSYLLSEVSKAAANALHQAGARLIFPAPRTTDDLDPDSDLNVANQLLAELPVGDPPTVLRQARIAAENRWKDLAEFAFLYAGLAHLREDVWQRQRDDVLECTAAWVTVEEVGYSPALAALWRLAAARKNTRDFLPAALTGTHAENGYGLPKSPLMDCAKPYSAKPCLPVFDVVWGWASANSSIAPVWSSVSVAVTRRGLRRSRVSPSIPGCASYLLTDCLPSTLPVKL